MRSPRPGYRSARRRRHTRAGPHPKSSARSLDWPHHEWIHCAPGHSHRRPPVAAARRPPASIPRPEYVGRDVPDEGRGGHLHSPEEVERIRAAGRIAADALVAIGRMIRPGITTDDIDAVAHTTTSSPTIRTRRRWGTGASPSRRARRSTSASATASPIPRCWRTETSSMSTSRRSGTASTATRTSRSSWATSTRSPGCSSSARTRRRCAGSAR